MVFIGLGSNLGGPEFDGPREALEAALAAMPAHGIAVGKLSHFYQSAPVPKSDQPWFVNGVAQVETGLSPGDLLQELHAIEARLGRQRRIRWEARIIDLDIIAYHDQIISADEIIIPHPRLHERLFVLKPLMDICPDWRHPVSGKSVQQLVQDVENTSGQEIIRLRSGDALL